MRDSLNQLFVDIMCPKLNITGLPGNFLPAPPLIPYSQTVVNELL